MEGKVLTKLMLLSSFQKWDLCVSLLFAHVLEVGTPMLKAHLNALMEVGAHPPHGVCWHFTQVPTAPTALNAETQLLQATELVAVAVSSS